MDITEKLNKYLKDGLVKDIYLARQNVAIFSRIANASTEINNADDNKIQLFSVLQQKAYQDAILAIARCFDSYKHKNATVSIEYMLEFLKKNVGQFSFYEHHNIELLLSKDEFLSAWTHLVHEDNVERFIDIIKKWHKCSIVNEPLYGSLDRVKQARNKLYAHRDLKFQGGGPSVEEMNLLLDHAEYIASIIGLSFERLWYSPNGEFLLAVDAEKSTKYVTKTLCDLGIKVD